MHHFLVIIEKANENYSAYSPDLPGCIATGETREEAVRNMEEAMRLHIEGLREDGLSIPEPRSLKEHQLQALAQTHGIWKDDPEIEEALRQLEQGRQEWRKKLDES